MVKDNNNSWPIIAIVAIIALLASVVIFITSTTSNLPNLPQQPSAYNSEQNIGGQAFARNDESIPKEYAQPYDSKDTNAQTYIDTEITSQDASKTTITIKILQDSQVTQQTIYKKMYYLLESESTWKELTLTTAKPTDDWVFGQATTTITIDTPNPAKNLFIIAYVCRKYQADNNWYCGASGETPSSEDKKWTLQTINTDKAVAAYAAAPSEPSVCTQGATRCVTNPEGNYYRTVDTQMETCTNNAWVKSTCGTGYYCAGSPAQCMCSPYMCPEGQSRCIQESGAIAGTPRSEICLKLANGCTYWALKNSCSSGTTCDDATGTCVKYTCGSPSYSTTFCATVKNTGMTRDGMTGLSCETGQCHQCMTGYTKQGTTCVPTPGITCLEPSFCQTVNSPQHFYAVAETSKTCPAGYNCYSCDSSRHFVKIVDSNTCTCEQGYHYVYNPANPDGSSCIAD